MSEQSNKYSIILPVRNGGNYVKECVNSILEQTYKEFNLLILDNNSTDGTAEWIRSLKNDKIQLIPSNKDLSIEENWKRIKDISKNEFMTMIGHDDLLHPDYLETMDSLINTYPDASLYQAHFNYIDAEGKPIRDCIAMNQTESPGQFLTKYLDRQIDVMGTGFMMRTKDYDAIGGIPMYPGLLFADFELWINLTKKKYLAVSPMKCFSFRIHASTTTLSTDEKYHRAFEQFVGYLKTLKTEKAEFEKIIRDHGADYLLFYCRGLCHRLLRTSKKKRGDLSVEKTIAQCKGYANELGITDFNPEKKKSIRMAKLIDSNPLTRSFFLIFKKIYPKPVLKK